MIRTLHCGCRVKKHDGATEIVALCVWAYNADDRIFTIQRMIERGEDTEADRHELVNLERKLRKHLETVLKG